MADWRTDGTFTQAQADTKSADKPAALPSVGDFDMKAFAAEAAMPAEGSDPW